jgi:hypothetical protein
MPLDGEVVGSSTIKGLTPRDHDVLILVAAFNNEAYRRAGLESPYACQKTYGLEETNNFEVWTDEKRNVDFIITDDPEMYKKFSDANELCVKLDLKKREDRVRLFQYIVYGNMT